MISAPQSGQRNARAVARAGEMRNSERQISKDVSNSGFTQENVVLKLIFRSWCRRSLIAPTTAGLAVTLGSSAGSFPNQTFLDWLLRSITNASLSGTTGLRPVTVLELSDSEIPANFDDGC